MMKKQVKRIITVILTIYGFTALTSCIKEELPNTECDILSAWVEGEQYESNFFQANQMRVDNISSNEKEIIFTVRSTFSLPKNLPVHFTITPGATIEPTNGSEQDFTEGPVTYTVTSQDGAWKREYKVVFREASLPSHTFGFEWVDEEMGYNNSIYHVFYEKDQSGNRHNIWASGNAGVTIVNPDWIPERFPTRSIADGYVGKGVCLNTQYAGDLGKLFGKPIAAGNLFLGKFNVDKVLSDPLKTTEFGIPIDKEPVRVTGYYKYQPGKEFTNAKMEVVPGRIDEASVYAVFYRNVDDDGNDVKLYGDDVFTNPNILKIAEVKSLPPTNEWTRFEMFFEGKDADDQLVESRGYNMTIVFSSSKEGAAFEGAIGSTLYIDEVEVSFELEDE